MRSFLLLVVFLAACGETSEPLGAVFPLGPKQAAVALAERFPDFAVNEANRWPQGAPSVEADLVAVRSAVLDLTARQATLREEALRLWPATITVDGDDSPFVAVELLAGPAGVSSVDDASVRVVAHGAVPRKDGDRAELIWHEEGARHFADLLTGRAEAQGGVAKLALFLRGRAPVRLSAGDPLPDPEGEGAVVVEIPLRSGP